MTELVAKLWEIVESLTELNIKTMDLLSQYTDVEEYEHDLAQILEGNDVIIVRAILHDLVVFASLIAAATRTTALRMGRST